MLVVVDWMSCTQSLKKAVAEIPGVEYVGMDFQEWVFSHAMKGWVRNVNVPIDLTKIEPAMLWATVGGTAQATGDSQGRAAASVDVSVLQDFFEGGQRQCDSGAQLPAAWRREPRPPSEGHPQRKRHRGG